MKKHRIATNAAKTVSDETLKTGPARLLTFLQGVTDPHIRAKFVPLGWSDERLVAAWGLLDELKAASVVAPPPAPDRVAEAIDACEAWQAAGLIRARAMLRLTFPEQAEFIFHDFEAGNGTAAVLNVSTFLQRRAALEKGAERKATRKEDHEALDVLEDAGVTNDVLARLHGYVDTVQTTVPAVPQRVDEVAAKRMEILRKIHAWLIAWGDMARTVITRRDQLIRLGLAKRRPRKAKEVVTDAPVSPVTPPAPASPVNSANDNTVAGGDDHDEPAPLSRAS